ncbi:FYVE, RhoGEF and PH domain-containing protein 4-like [Physella acuta]|uniref:FYVE, RhoGEF and PH domain-containing protein 4-like n=1 Tax=Physella acuta TaxID=109671 RepID=UPI0027DB2B73|nr:FYVE, RhoGEF and PH domain-containing protein 4-like [Physella acuta]
MGQDISVEDLRQGIKLDEAVEQLITNISKRIKGDNPLGYIVYTRHRTRHGAPTINRRSYGEEELLRFQAENDGFPMAATAEEIRDFDKSLFQGRQAKPKKPWGRSLSDAASFKQFRRLPAPSRPKFIDKLLTGASNLSRIYPGKSRTSKRASSPEQSKFYVAYPATHSDPIGEVLPACSSKDATEQNDERFVCERCSTVKDRSSSSDPVKNICVDCDENNAYEGFDFHFEYTSDVHSGVRENQEEPLYDVVSDVNSVTDVDIVDSGRNSNTFAFQNCEDHLREEKNQDEVVYEFCNTDNLIVYEEVDVRDTTGENCDSELSVDIPDCSDAANPPQISPGFVRRQCQVFLQSTQSQESSPCTGKKVQRSASDLTSPAIRHRQKRQSEGKIEQGDRWVKNYNLSRNTKFTEAVMAKGYVKALAEQINHQGALQIPEDDDDDNDKKKNEDDDLSMLMSYKSDEARKSLVQELIDAAERSNGIKENGVGGPNRTPTRHLVTGNDSAGSHGSCSLASSTASLHLPKSPIKVNGDVSHLSINKCNGNTKCNAQNLSGTSGSSPSSSNCVKKTSTSSPSPKPSPKSSPKPSPKRFFLFSQSQKSQQSSAESSPQREKPPVDYSSKPRISQKISMSGIPSPSSTTTSPTRSATSPVGNDFTQRISILTQTLSSSNDDEVFLRETSKRSSDTYRDSVFRTIYDNGPALSAAELFDSSWSDSDSCDGSDDDETDSNKKHAKKQNKTEEDKPEPQVTEQPEVPPADKRFRVASELLQTERDYVSRLHLLHQGFFFRLDKENRQQTILPPNTLSQMFSNTKSIYLFHHDFLLPQLEDRMKNWEKDPRIGDLMKKNAPFLKMYTEYIRNFDQAMKLINQWLEKSTKFSEIIQDIQKLPECGSLSLQHHMMGPIQRVPRYELLLKEYIKHLPANSPDMNDAKDALDLVSKAASHSNDAMKKIETFHKLLDIYQSLRGVPIDFISPTREFVTQGPITKISARSGERQPRQIFLFNDLVLVCTAYNILGTFSVRSSLEVESLEVMPGNNMNIPNTFMLRSKQKAVELLDENPGGEIFGWEMKIEEVITKYKTRERCIKHEEVQKYSPEMSVPESCLGTTAPVWIPDDAATMCMLCQITFNVVRRRHHCRSCGKLICKSCCKKAPLEYKKGKIERVCAACYDVIVNKRGKSESDHSPKKKGILQVKASERGLISGYLMYSEDCHTWQKLWVTAHKEFVLYTFRAHEDVSAISSLPLPGHIVEPVRNIEGKHHVFSLTHKNKRVCLYQAESEKHMKRWVAILKKLANAELPEENARFSSVSNSSNASSASDGAANNSSSTDNNNRHSTHSGSQADSGYPGDSNNSLSALAVDTDMENLDGISQYDNVDAGVSD